MYCRYILDVSLTVTDARVAAALCMGCTIKYAIVEDSNMIDE